MTRARLAVALVIGVLVAGMTAAPATAVTGDDIEVDPQIAEMLAEVPGGIVIDAGHAVWPESGMELTVPAASASPSLSARAAAAAAVGSCATGKICLYSGYSLTGSVLTFGVCGIHAIPSTFTTRSLANARSSGYTQAKSGSTIRATVYSGSWANVYGSANSIRCTL